MKCGMERPSIARILISALCGGAGIVLMIKLAEISAVPLGMIPFATSIVLVALIE